MAQKRYWIVATRRCTTHPEGTVLCYTGSRADVARGWKVVSPVAVQPHTQGGQWRF